MRLDVAKFNFRLNDSSGYSASSSLEIMMLSLSQISYRAKTGSTSHSISMLVWTCKIYKGNVAETMNFGVS